MKFAFLIHPISSEISDLIRLDQETGVLSNWGRDPLGLLSQIHGFKAAQYYGSTDRASKPMVIDEILGPPSVNGHEVRGQMIEIPMRAAEILEHPDQAVEHITTAVQMAADWGAEVVGLGAMTAVVGGRGTFVAEHSSIAITTGNSLTVFAAVQAVYNAMRELELDLSRETVAVVGVPGSIASAAATMLAPQCKELLLVGRRASSPAVKLAAQLGTELLLDIDEACRRARIILTATSSGNCIDQGRLQPGTIVIDVGVPADVIGEKAVRSDVLLLTGGLTAVPTDGRWHSPRVLRFQLGMIPSCLGETMMLALGDRAESYSLGRVLDVDKINEIGEMAICNGFDFFRLCSFGQPLDDAVLVEFRKSLKRLPGTSSRSVASPPPSEQGSIETSLRYRRHINPPMSAYFTNAGIGRVFVRAEGNWLYDEFGHQYLDAVAGNGSVNLGHNPPAVMQGIQQAITSQAPGATPAGANPWVAALAEELVLHSPAGLQMATFTSSGTEANAIAARLARTVTGRSSVLYCLGSASPEGPSESVPYGDSQALRRELSSGKYAAFLVEPIQGEAGVWIPPCGYLREAAELCHQAGTLLVVDESQTGLGRTGSLFLCEQEDVQPDVLTLGESLTGGTMPLGALLTRRDLWNRAYGTVQSCLNHNSTFTGSSLACAAGLAALKEIEQQHHAEHAQELGEYLLRELRAVASRYNCLKEVRGHGLMIGIEFHKWPGTAIKHWKMLDPTDMSQYMVADYEEMMAALFPLQAIYILLNRFGIHAQTARNNLQVLRIQPPLTMTQDDVSHLLNAMDTVGREIDHICNALTGGVSKAALGRHDAKTQTTQSRILPVGNTSNGHHPAGD